MSTRSSSNSDRADAELSLREARVAYAIGYFDDVEVVEWARTTNAFDDHFGEASVAELLSLNTKNRRKLDQVHSLFQQVVDGVDPKFGMESADAEIIARRLFSRRVQACICGDSRIWDICRMVSQIEWRFDYPDWLGDMYNVCDWLHPDSVTDVGIDAALRKQLEFMESAR